MKWWRVFFKGGDEDRPHEEVFGVKAEDIDGARAQALKEMREEFMIRYPEIYRIEENGDDIVTDNMTDEDFAAAVEATCSPTAKELDRLRAIEAAARNLIAVKGRHHSEIAMCRLIEALTHNAEITGRASGPG